MENSSKVEFLFLNEEDMIKAGVTDMGRCVDVMTEMFELLGKGDYIMGSKNHNSHGIMIDFPENPKFEGMPKTGPDRRFMAMDVSKSVVKNGTAQTRKILKKVFPVQSLCIH